MKRLILSLCISLLSLTIQGAERLPHIHIIATGGTIAGAASSSTSESYSPASKDISTILASIPELHAIAQISSEQIFNIPSQDIDSEQWLQLSARVNELLEEDQVDGIVITHGTDILEESAYFLSLTTDSPKPIVLTGSMRPSTAMSADGPYNLFSAVLTAGSELSRERGVLVVLNNTILSARSATKTHSHNVETFQAPNSGALGVVYGERVSYYAPATHPRNSAPAFDLAGIDSLPRVGIIYGHGGMDTTVVNALLEADFKGIVFAGVGNGNIHHSNLPLLEKAVREGVAVVRSTRVPTGATSKDGEIDDRRLGFVVSGELPPHKARILLMLALTQSPNRKELQHLFDIY